MGGAPGRLDTATGTGRGAPLREGEENFQDFVGGLVGGDAVHVGEDDYAEAAVGGDEEVGVGALLAAGMACGADAEFVGYEPSQSVVAGLAGRGLRGRPPGVARASRRA